MVFSRQPLRFLVSVVLTVGLVLSGGADGRAWRPSEESGEPAGAAQAASTAAAALGAGTATAVAARGTLGRSDDPVVVSGRVYEGAVGDEGRELAGVEVVLYGGNNSWPTLGTPVATTTTDGEGWYGLEMEAGFETYQIRPEVPEGYTAVGAATVDGVVRSAEWIEYAIPLEGKVLTGNTFWVGPPVLSGRVYEGSVGDEREPLEGVTVTLHCANNPGVVGDPIDTTATDEEGWYGVWAYAGCEYYNVVETDPAGYVSAGATTVGGTVEGENWIQYPIPLEGRTLTGNKFWDLASGPGELADLRVTDLWREGEMVCYQVRNEGSGPAEAGHVTALYADGAYETAEPVEVELGTDEAYAFCFEWACTGDEDVLEVRADVEGLVPEGDEGNNSREEVWTCDGEPPAIISEIEVEVGRDWAVVRWETNELADGRVRYGATASGYGDDGHDPALRNTHAITLTGLSPATTYQGLAASADAARNEVESEPFLFETLAPEPGWGPVVGLEAPEVVSGTVTISATAEAEAGVEQVAFLLDGEVVLTDYAPPYEVTVDSTVLENGLADLAARAVDKAGQPAEAPRQVDVQNVKDATAPGVTITAPTQGASVSGIVTCTALLTDDVGIVSARFYVDGDYQQFEPFDVTNAPKTATVEFPWNTRAVTDGVGYRLAVEVYDGEGKTGLDTVDVTVNQVAPTPPPSPPWLEVEAQTLVRIQNRFLVGLRVKNTGDFEARNVVIRHGVRGFQPIEDLAGHQVLARYHPTGRYGYAEIRAGSSIPAGQSGLFFYNVMPVLLEAAGSGPEVGSFVDMDWDSPTQSGYHNYVVQPIGKTVGGETVAQAHASAVKAADYLIVTNPKRLFQVYNPGLNRSQPYCDRLLSTMAELAWEKKGALGYVDAYSAPKLQNLIKQGGAWSGKMAPGWTSKGYLLLVGEQQIVPGWSRYHGTQYTTRGDIPFTASPTDYPYASTAGSELKPELAMGRIIGDTPALQLIAIRNSLYSYRGESGYDYDGLFTLAANGFPACWHGGCDKIDFAHEVNRLPQVLSGATTAMR